MINLIPPAGFRVLKREYLMRVGATSGFIIGGVFLLLTATLAPTYILTRAQIQEYQTRMEGIGNEAQTFADAEKEAEMTQVLLAQLQVNPSSLRASDVLREIERVTPDGITFKTFALQSIAGVAKTVQIQGTASTREALIQFKKAVEASDVFEKAEIPIADFAKDVDLPFAVTISFTVTP